MVQYVITLTSEHSKDEYPRSKLREGYDLTAHEKKCTLNMQEKISDLTGSQNYK